MDKRSSNVKCEEDWDRPWQSWRRKSHPNLRVNTGNCQHVIHILVYIYFVFKRAVLKWLMWVTTSDVLVNCCRMFQDVWPGGIERNWRRKKRHSSLNYWMSLLLLKFWTKYLFPSLKCIFLFVTIVIFLYYILKILIQGNKKELASDTWSLWTGSWLDDLRCWCMHPIAWEPYAPVSTRKREESVTDLWDSSHVCTSLFYRDYRDHVGPEYKPKSSQKCWDQANCKLSPTTLRAVLLQPTTVHI